MLKTRIGYTIRLHLYEILKHVENIPQHKNGNCYCLRKTALWKGMIKMETLTGNEQDEPFWYNEIKMYHNNL